ncbi:hypothetical protein H6G96_04165 [Nostoc sp. FACHB-892]|nr:hypothetical protein [Nostoc sp. FACHB-892]
MLEMLFLQATSSDRVISKETHSHSSSYKSGNDLALDQVAEVAENFYSN